MADYGAAVTWGEVKPGRERQSLEVWADSVSLNEKAVADGRLERWDAIILEPTGAPPAGVIRVYGSQEQVEAFLDSDDFTELILRASLSVSAVGYRRFTTGDALAEGFARFTAAVESL
jgi:hypothetical protein